MDKFIIDRQFGVALWIDVEKGIVQRCYNEEPKFIEKMNERYVGKSITYLKEDFIDRAMKGTYHNLKPEALVSLRQIAWANESKVKNTYVLINMNLRTKPEDPEGLAKLQEQAKEFEKEQYKAEAKLELETERILNEHNFKS